MAAAVPLEAEPTLEKSILDLDVGIDIFYSCSYAECDSNKVG